MVPPADTPATPPPSPPAYPSPEQALEFMQKMFNPLGLAVPGFGVPGAAPVAPAPWASMPFPNASMMFAALDPAEVQRKIDELRVIENWLAMTLSMMQMSSKTLELQKASLEAMRSASPGGAHEPRRGPAQR